MHNSSSFTVQISFAPSGNVDLVPNQPNAYVDFPLGTPLPHAGDKIVIDDISYKVIDRALIISDNVIRDASWSLFVERCVVS